MTHIVFDVSILGIGMVNSLDRTGIFRYTDCLLKGLLKASPQNLVLYTNRSLKSWVQSYLQSNGDMANSTFHSQGSLLCAMMTQGLWHLFGSLNFRGDIRRCMLAPWWWDQYYFSRFPEWPKNHLFHSPFFPFPRKHPLPGQTRILTIHDLIPLTHPYFCSFSASRRMRVLKHNLHPKDWIIAVSHYTKTQIIEHLNHPEEHIVVIPEAAAPHFRPVPDANRLKQVQQQYGIPDAPYILGVGTLEPRKNSIGLLESFNRLIHHTPMPDVYLVLAGEMGWQLNRSLKTLFRQNKALAKRVIVTGFVEEADLPVLYSHALCFAFPSLCEGFGLPPLEAMQCGAPVVVSNTTSLPEVVGQAGIILPPTDYDAWAQAFLQLLNHSSHRQHLVEQSLQQAGQFNWNYCVEQTLDAYKTALNE